MKLYLLPFLLLFACKNKDENQLKCKDFRLGKYELLSPENNLKYIIQRSENMQSETQFNLETGEQIKATVYFKLKWKNDCEFNLMVDTVKNKYDEFDLFLNQSGGLDMKIIKTQGKCVTIETNLNNENPVESVSCKIE